MSRIQFLAGAAALLLTACTSAPRESAAPSAPASVAASASAPVLNSVADDAVYGPVSDVVKDSEPGRILAQEEITAPTGMRAWTVTYGSTGLDGQPIAVSGMILAPAEAPADGTTYPVVAWAHGTTGIADPCAPSKQGVANGIPPDIRELVGLGYVVAATDYEGLGTEGLHPYLVGTSEGRSVLDSILAAQALADAHAGPQAVVIGHSQGGHAALWAAEQAPIYAPDLDLLGAFAASPVTDMTAWETWAFEQASAGEIGPALAPLLLFGDWNDVYGLPLDFLTDAAQQGAIAPREACIDPNPGAMPPYLADPALRPDWGARLAENSPGHTRTPVPVVVVSPDSDSAVQYESQVSGVIAMCAIGDSVELRTVSGDHDASIYGATAWPAVEAWIADRFAAVPLISTC